MAQRLQAVPDAKVGNRRRQPRATPSSTAESDDSVSQPAAPKKNMTLKAAAESSRRDALVKLRDMTADQLSNKPNAAAFAALSKRFLELDDEIRSIDLKAEQDGKSQGSSSSEADDGWDSSEI